MKHRFSRASVLIFAPGVVVGILVSCSAPGQYQLTRLTANAIGQAEHLDPNLVNGWGLTLVANGPIFITDTGTGLATSYNGQGLPQKQIIAVPSAGGTGLGTPAGIVLNNSNEFEAGGAPATFLFGTLDGTISGWSPANGNNAVILVNNSSSGASYNGLAITNRVSGNYLYAPDFTNNRVDVYDGKLNFVTSLIDTTIPMGFVPLNVQDIVGSVYVAYANAIQAWVVGLLTSSKKTAHWSGVLRRENP